LPHNTFGEKREVVMGVYFGKLRVGVELPKYDVVQKCSKGYEIRKYFSCVAAEICVDEGNQHKGSGGFRPLAEYIGAFGAPNNRKKEAIKMTAPVVTQAMETEKGGEKIAMTAPVVTGGTRDDKGAEGYWMQFIMPSKWTMETLPEPTNPKVRLREIPERHVAALYFSGRTNAQIVEQKEKKLLEDLRADGVQIKDGCKPELARYNDPFTPGFLRTNEVWVEINAPPSKPPPAS
jgi:hypothetical protein